MTPPRTRGGTAALPDDGADTKGSPETETETKSPPDTPHIGTHQMRALHGELRRHGITTDEAVHDYLSVHLGRDLTSRKDITATEAAHLLADLADTPTVKANGGIYTALAAVMADVDHVAKRDRNSQQGFSFRGVDAVVNAVGPALRKHRVLVLPELRNVTYEAMPLSSGKTATVCRVVVAYRFSAPDGSSIESVVAAEAFDMGDKATPKAMSVAFRTALLQSLALPTDEPDPDSQTYEQGLRPAPPPQAAPSPPPIDPDLTELGTSDLLGIVDDLARSINATYAGFTEKFRASHTPPLSVDDLDTLPAETVARFVTNARAFIAANAGTRDD